MAKRKRKKNAVLQDAMKSNTTMEMTPMIDVTFQLLIFFMLTIKFKILEGKLAAYLPKDVGVNQSDAEPKEKTDIRVSVLKEGSKLDPYDDVAWSGQGAFRYGDDRELLFAVGPHKTKVLGDLRSRLRKMYEVDPEEAAATIDAARGTVYEDIIGVLDVTISAGFSDITFKGAPPPSAKN